LILAQDLGGMMHFHASSPNAFSFKESDVLRAMEQFLCFHPTT